jgi:putative ABC transport system permease protein
VRVLPREQADFDTLGPPPTLPASVGEQVEKVDGVKEAVPAYENLTVSVVDDKGERVGPTTGAPTLVFSLVPERFDVFEYEGRAPESDGEAALNRSAAEDAGLKVGDRIRVQGTGSARPYEIVGLGTFGGKGVAGGAGFIVLTLPRPRRSGTRRAGSPTSPWRPRRASARPSSSRAWSPRSARTTSSGRARRTRRRTRRTSARSSAT